MNAGSYRSRRPRMNSTLFAIDDAPAMEACTQPLPERGLVEIAPVRPEPDDAVLVSSLDSQRHLQFHVHHRQLSEDCFFATVLPEEIQNGELVVAGECFQFEASPSVPFGIQEV